MRTRVFHALFCMVVTLAVGGACGDRNTVNDINGAVASLDDSISRDEFPFLVIDENVESEGTPPSLKMYHDGDRLVAVFVSVGHETWATEFRYYFHSNQEPMKFLKIVHGRPDNPPKQAVIYSSDGNVVWKNTDDIPYPFKKLKELFSNLQEARLRLSRY